MLGTLRQAWWAPVAGLIVVGQVLMAVTFAFDSEDAGEMAVGIGVSLVGAAVMAAGLWKRPRARGLGNALIVVGALMAMFWFWSLVLPIAGLIVIVGLVITEVRSPARATGTP